MVRDDDVVLGGSQVVEKDRAAKGYGKLGYLFSSSVEAVIAANLSTEKFIAVAMEVSGPGVVLGVGGEGPLGAKDGGLEGRGGYVVE